MLNKKRSEKIYSETIYSETIYTAYSVRYSMIGDEVYVIRSQ